tara:strand:+ start:556 stop:759 length:204 start_codon:yes stop_codon:yes gene_type:complete
MVDRLKLFLLKTFLRFEGWKKIEDGWRYRGVVVTGDGSDVLRMIARRLFARERIRKRKKNKNYDKQT